MTLPVCGIAQRPGVRPLHLDDQIRLPLGGPAATVAGFMSDNPSEISHDQHAVRRQKLAELRAAGKDPFSANAGQTHCSAAAIKAYVEGQDSAVTVSVAGRVVVIRDM